MHEESAPEGYAQGADVEFYFNGDGTIPNCGYHLVKMVDQPSATPTPSNPSENPDKTPNPDGDPTPGEPGDDPNTLGNPGAISNGDGDTPKISPTAPPNVPAFANGQYGLPTGDSPAMWIFLALAVVCIGAAVGVTVVRKAYAEEHPDVVAAFLADYAQSVNAANTDLEGTAALCEEQGVVAKAAIAKKALPNCNIVCLTGEELKADVSGYLQVLYDADPAAVGGTLPGEDFYWAAQ